MPDSLLQANIVALIDSLRATKSLAPQLAIAAEMICEALKDGKKLLTCGNGGSAADAMHMATEFVCRYVDDRRAYPAISLNASGSDLTAIGNDYAFEEIFARGVSAFGLPGDVLVVFTTSGKSRNIEKAMAVAKERGLQTIAFLGRDGGTAKGQADVELLVPGTLSARIQEVHKLLLHTLCELVERELPKD
ncbi:MAG TPA: SIS domain-containing protein [Tepidisphaeraceae bacterium]|jgi:D-sedoheptulose 7-phosphate isomerase|nr:SIS domain-containing protein [Tepidisphaeraceae bacterium]